MLITRLAAFTLALTLAVTLALNLTPIPVFMALDIPSESEEEELPYASMESDGNTLRVLLPANPSTGFEWTYEIGDPSVLECTAAGFLSPDDPAPGTPGHYAASFRSLLPNAETTLSLDYARPWEGSAVETLRLLISTDGDGYLTAVITESTIFEPDAPEEDEGMANFEMDGGLLTVRLPGNITTGYEWTGVIGDESVIRLEGSEYLASETEELVDGAGGVFVFRYESLKSNCETTLSFVYERNGEHNPIDRIDLIVFTDAEGSIDIVETEAE